jgi:hypothetical protein
VIQIAVIPEAEKHLIALFALTEDGTIAWNIFDPAADPADYWGGWQPVPKIQWVPAPPPER